MDEFEPCSGGQPTQDDFDRIVNNLAEYRKGLDERVVRVSRIMDMAEVCRGYWAEWNPPDSMPGTVASAWSAVHLWGDNSESLVKEASVDAARIVDVSGIATNVGLVTEAAALSTPGAQHYAHEVRRVLDLDDARQRVAEALRKLSSAAADAYAQAWTTLDRPGNDSGRAAMSEMREVYSLVMRTLAPEEGVISDSGFEPDATLVGQGKSGVTRRHRLNYIAKHHAISARSAEVIQNSAQSDVKVYNDLSSMHSGKAVPIEKARSIMGLCDSLLESLLRATGYLNV